MRRVWEKLKSHKTPLKYSAPNGYISRILVYQDVRPNQDVIPSETHLSSVCIVLQNPSLETTQVIKGYCRRALLMSIKDRGIVKYLWCSKLSTAFHVEIS